MKRKRSVLGIILTVVGVVLIVGAATTDLWYEGARPGFGWHQQVAVALGVALLLLGGLFCCRSSKCAAEPEGEAAPPPPEPAEAPEEPTEGEAPAEEAGGPPKEG